MTDIEKLRALFDEWGVGYTEQDDIVELMAGNEKIDGYTLFRANFVFTPAGRFVEVGIWE